MGVCDPPAVDWLVIGFVALQAIAVVAPFYMQWAVDGAVVSADRDLLTVSGVAPGTRLQPVYLD